MLFHMNFGAFDGSGFGSDNSEGANPFGFPPRPQRKQRPRRPRKAIGNPVTRIIINLAVTLVFAAVYFYLELPALNFHSADLYYFLIICVVVYCACALFTAGTQGNGSAQDAVRFLKKQCKAPVLLTCVLLVVALVGYITSWVVFRAASYSQLLTIQSGDFAAEVEEISYGQIPMLDSDSAARLGARKLGELADMVSQFEVLDNYTQINYQGRPVRVTSLGYADIIKWFTNRSEGLPAYLIVDMVTQDVTVVRLDEGMRYTTAEHLGRNLYRHLRFRYPTMMFSEPVFEIDEEGTPWWVCPRVVKTIGLFGGTDIRGAVLVNAITGESEYYEEVPSWVDQVYVASLIMQQYDYYGLYHNGFFNSILGQRDVTQTTDGYNYIAIGDDVYMYTGVTSVTSDQSNIGFLLSNQRTKETHFYSVAGATEESAQRSAEGQVQQMSYDATFPLLLNIADQPTYFLALKDAAGLVKMYAMVNVEQYQIVSTGSTVTACETNYRQALSDNNLIDGSQSGVSQLKRDSGTIAEIRSSVIGGNTHYYVRLQGSVGYLDFSAADIPRAVLLNTGDRINVRYYQTGDTVAAGDILTAEAFWYDGEEEPAAVEESNNMEEPDTVEETELDDTAQE